VIPIYLSSRMSLRNMPAISWIMAWRAVRFRITPSNDRLDDRIYPVASAAQGKAGQKSKGILVRRGAQSDRKLGAEGAESHALRLGGMMPTP
jgi:hypothetical protein